jgi:hypothetical protein
MCWTPVMREVAFGEWPKLNEADYLAIGRPVMFCNFVELKRSTARAQNV